MTKENRKLLQDAVIHHYNRMGADFWIVVCGLNDDDLKAFGRTVTIGTITIHKLDVAQLHKVANDLN